MPANNPSDQERSAGQIQEAAHLARTMESTEVARRLTVLETTVGKLENSLLERHTKIITIIFSCVTLFVAVCAILVTLLGILAKSDSHEATLEMQSKVKDALADVDKKFQALAGEAFKKPAVQLFYNNLPLENQVVEMTPTQGMLNISPLDVSLNNLLMKNVGDKRTEPLSIKLSVAGPFDLGYGTADWEEGNSIEKQYAATFHSKRVELTVSPGEALNVDPIILVTESAGLIMRTNFACKIQVFYGGEKPAEAQFRVHVKQ
jgi:hypothetical protein